MTGHFEDESALDEFVDYFNARDLDGIGELLHPEATSEFFGGGSAAEILEGMSEFVLRYPTLVTTRGERDEEPIVGAWIVDQEQQYRSTGYFTFLFCPGEDGETCIERIEYVDAAEADVDRLLLEEPDPEEIAEWEDWRAWDES